MTTAEFNKALEAQVDLTKVGIYEAFVKQGELRKYWELEGDHDSQMMQKVFLPVFDGEIVCISLEKRRAITSLFEAADVESFKELEALGK